MNYLVVILIVVIVGLLFWGYQTLTNNALTSGQQSLDTVISYSAETKLKNPGAATYSYEVWLFIQSPPAQKTPILKRGMDFGVYLNQNTLTVDCSGKTVMTVTDSFPVQKWTHLVVNVLNQKNVESYINGKLVKTVATSDKIVSSAKTPLTVGSTTLKGGLLTKLTYLPSALDGQQVSNNYLGGNGLTTFMNNPYGLRMEITDGEQTSRLFKII